MNNDIYMEPMGHFKVRNTTYSATQSEKFVTKRKQELGYNLKFRNSLESIKGRNGSHDYTQQFDWFIMRNVRGYSH